VHLDENIVGERDPQGRPAHFLGDLQGRTGLAASVNEKNVFWNRLLYSES